LINKKQTRDFSINKKMNHKFLNQQKIYISKNKFSQSTKNGQFFLLINKKMWPVFVDQ